MVQNIPPVLIKDTYAIAQMHIRCSVISGQILIACKYNACNQDLLNVYSSFSMCSQESVGMLDRLHVLYEGEIAISRVEDGRGVLEALMQCAQSHNAMPNRWLHMA